VGQVRVVSRTYIWLTDRFYFGASKHHIINRTIPLHASLVADKLQLGALRGEEAEASKEPRLPFISPFASMTYPACMSVVRPGYINSSL
jgi:hypothetical protein